MYHDKRHPSDMRPTGVIEGCATFYIWNRVFSNHAVTAQL